MVFDETFYSTKNDQTFPTIVRLIPDSREYFFNKNLHYKLFRRFWRTLNAYDQGNIYAEILRMFFSGLCKYEIASHRKVTNSNLAY